MKKLLALIVIFLILLLVIRGWWNNELSPVSKDTVEKRVVIEKWKRLEIKAKYNAEEEALESELEKQTVTAPDKRKKAEEGYKKSVNVLDGKISDLRKILFRKKSVKN